MDFRLQDKRPDNGQTDVVHRLRPLPWSAMDERQKSIYASVVGSRTVDVGAERSLPGPFNAMLYSPDVGNPLQALGAAIRSTGSLPPRAREIATLTVAAHFDSEYEWARHSTIARSLGVTDDELAALRASTPVRFADPFEAGVHTLTGQLLRDGDLDDDDYAAAIALLGESGVVTVSILVGYYALLAMQLRLFRVGAPDVDDPATPDAGF